MRLEAGPSVAFRSRLCLPPSSQCRAPRPFHWSRQIQAPACSSWQSTIQGERQQQAATRARSSVRAYTTGRPPFRNNVEGESQPTAKSSAPEQLRLETQKRAEAAAERARARIVERNQTPPSQGSLAEDSLFSGKRQRQELRSLGRSPAFHEDVAELDPAALELRDPSRLAMAINPRPAARARGLRRMVIRSVRHRGRLTKAVKLARTERSALSRSEFFKTSMKKLAPLTRQIAGKPIDEAILQMRFSKKKVAKEVREHLIHAKNEAIVRKGMGLPSEPEPAAAATTTTTSSPQTPSPDTSFSFPAATSAPITINRPYEPGRPAKAKYLPGTTIPSQPSQRNPTDIYIAQSWINRGPYGKDMDHRAFGRINTLRPPTTGISVLLSEEKTRLRQMREKEDRSIRRRVRLRSMWKHLPDRKIVRQSQYVLW